MRPPPPAPEPGRVDNAAGGFSYVVPAGWKVSDATQLSYGQALLTKAPPEGTPPPQPGQQARSPPNDTSVLLGRLDMKLFAGAEADNAKAATRLASDMGEFFMPFPGTRVNQENGALAAGDMPGAFSAYDVKFTDTNKPTGQIWAGVVGNATPTVAPGQPHDSARPAQRAVVRGLARYREQSGRQGRSRDARQFHPAVESAAATRAGPEQLRHRRIRMRHRRIPMRRRRIRMRRRAPAAGRPPVGVGVPVDPANCAGDDARGLTTTARTADPRSGRPFSFT